MHGRTRSKEWMILAFYGARPLQPAKLSARQARLDANADSSHGTKIPKVTTKHGHCSFEQAMAAAQTSKTNQPPQPSPSPQHYNSITVPQTSHCHTQPGMVVLDTNNHPNPHTCISPLIPPPAAAATSRSRCMPVMADWVLTEGAQGY